MIIWNKETKTNINTFLKNFTTIETSTCGNEVIAVITKKQELTNGLINCKKDVADLSNQYIEVIQYFNKFSNSLSYHWNFFKLRTIQFFAQLFSSSTRQKIKKLIKK